MSRPSILPDDHAQFNSKDYWDKFFTQRGQFAFEWYGDFGEVFPTLSASLSKTARILVIGCGNSNFSSDLYDKGYRNIVNLDFSELVIEEMRAKNLQRPEMQWIVGDMTALSSYFPLKSFDAVIDKGALDALMSEPSEATSANAQKMFDEIAQVLSDAGKYFLISLAEDYVFHAVYEYFMKSRREGQEFDWSVSVSQIVTVKPSPFVPILFTFAKTTAAVNRQAVMNLSAVSNKHVVKTGKQKAAERTLMPFEELSGYLKHFQEFNQMTYRLGKLQVGRFETVPLWSNESSEVPRFTLYILDASEQASLSMAVFFIPFGREADFQFTTKDGIIDIAFQAACKRFVVVACNRPHTFGEMSELQDELSPIIMSLKMADMDPTEKIPYMAVAQDKSWEEIEQGKSAVSGIYVVEEQEEDDEDSNAVYRRLIFLQNQQFIQTEVRLVPPPTAKKSAGGKKKKGSKGKKTASAPSERPALVFDYKYLDDHHKGMLASLSLNQSFVVNASQRGAAVPTSALLVGLGGGALTMALQRFLPSLHITACELDEVVHDVARRHFGFEASASTKVLIQEGVSLINEFSEKVQSEPADLQDVVIIDVDSKDPSLGLSAPPREFINFETLEHMHKVLKPGGILLMNVVARSKSMLSDLIARIKMVFNAQASAAVVPSSTHDAARGRVLELKPSNETVNICLVCVKAGGSSSPQTVPSAGKSKKPPAAIKEQVQWAKTLETWLSNCGHSDDPLGMEELLDKLHDA